MKQWSCGVHINNSKKGNNMNIRQIACICVISVSSLVFGVRQRSANINKLGNTEINRICVLTRLISENGSNYAALKYSPERRKEVQDACNDLEAMFLFVAHGNKHNVTDDELRKAVEAIVGTEDVDVINAEIAQCKAKIKELENQRAARVGSDPRKIVGKN
jgi:hypothetical protein